MQKAFHPSYSFEGFTLDSRRGCLLRAGEEVKLRPKSYQALKYLLENNGRLVGKEELMQALWPDSFVTDDSLVKSLRDVRLALGDNAQHFIKTVPRRGYIFSVQVNDSSSANTAALYSDQVESIRIVIEDEQQDYEPARERANEPGANLLLPAASIHT